MLGLPTLSTLLLSFLTPAPSSPRPSPRSIKVTNLSTGQSVKMRVVDMCGQGCVDMDPLGFNAIGGCCAKPAHSLQPTAGFAGQPHCMQPSASPGVGVRVALPCSAPLLTASLSLLLLADGNGRGKADGSMNVSLEWC